MRVEAGDTISRRAEIVAALETIQAEEDVRILYACESGSRAWGFASRDSDYDVRFVYVRRPAWYLAIDLEHRRDVIERPLTDELDISGWDLRKALQLLRKSNPPLLEWFDSPIVYFEQPAITAMMRAVLPDYYSPIASMYHYLSMARGNYRDYLRGEQVWVKKYFYVLRPVLAIKWIEQGLGMVPMAFGTLVERLIDDAVLRREIDELLERKLAGDELDQGPRSPAISEFLSAEMERFEKLVPPSAPRKPPVEELNTLFRQILVQTYGNTF